MAQITIDLVQLETELQTLISTASQRDILIGEQFQTMYNTGLRACEVLEVKRWQRLDSGQYLVQLSKGEGTREISPELVGKNLRYHYDTGTQFIMQTYSAVNNLYKRTAPVLHFNGNSKRTTMHAFRYRYIKMLAAQGKTISEIAAEMGHLNQANTARYVNDQIRMYEV